MATRDTGTTPKARPSRQNSSGVNANAANQNATAACGVQVKSEPIEEYAPMFFQEISDIMRGYGDCERPQHDSVILVEQIVIQQMRSILNDVINLALERKGKPVPAQKDFEYLMRRNPIRIFRLQKHIKDLDFRRRYHDMLTGRSTSYADDDGDKSEDDIGAEVSEQYDEEKVRRLFRADRISLTLNGPQYAQYNEARRTSFHCRNSTNIRTKLKALLCPPSEAKISAHVYTILGFLVHETIATIVDYAILTRLNSDNRAVDPFSRITSSGKL